MKRVIINADDFGWSAPLNRAIVEAHHRGILSSATLLTNFPGFDNAVELARQTPSLGVGLHLNIVHGVPLSPPEQIPSLVGNNGNFAGMSTILRRAMMGRLQRSDLDRELSAQLQRCREQLGEPTHLDSHKHVHIFRPIRDAFIALAGQLGSPRLRTPHETLQLGISVRDWQCRVFRILARRTKADVQRAGCVTPDHFIGVADTGRMTSAVYHRVFNMLVDGVTEIMCHPGPANSNDGVTGSYFITTSRELEFNALLDPVLIDRISSSDIQQIHYGQIPTDTATPWK
jgi:predicted glycoside hydrolase/deacetylase ChbG (UPF0249 family)